MTQVAHALSDADDLIVGMINDFALPGLAVGIIHDGELVYGKGFGLADAERGVPVTTETIFRIGSVSKTLVAIALLQLSEQGMLDLDDPVSRHLRSFELRGRGPRPITLRHLLTHTSGLGEMRRLTDLLTTEGKLRVAPGRPAPALSTYYRRGLSAEGPPGRQWAYANHGFAVLGQVIEDVSGQAFGDYLRDNVLDRLGMKRSDFFRNARVGDGVAVGYGPPRRATPVKYHDIAIPPAGSLFSSIDDMARYVVALLQGGANDAGRVLQSETLATMLAPHFTIDDRLSFTQGLSFMGERWHGHRVAHHGGGWAGFTSMMMVAPEAKLGVLAFANGSGSGPAPIARSLLRRLLGLPEVDPLPVAGLPERPDLWPELVGHYGPLPGLLRSVRPTQLGREFQVLVADDHLAVRALWGPLRRPQRLYPTDPSDPFVFAAHVDDHGHPTPIELAFTTDATGQVTGLNGTLGIPLQLRRRPRVQALRTKLRTTAAVAGVGVAAAGARRLRGDGR